ncbi:MAG: Gfo/Idh/MocA family protein [Anaerolineaceae bacterium]
MANKIRWGIIGAGYIAGKFAQALSFIPEAEVYAVASRSRKSAEKFAQENNVSMVHDSYQALFDDPKVDVVYIATINTAHRENCLAAIKAGKPILCEKPFMVNSKEAEEVIALAKEHKVFLMEALWTRFIPAFIKARQMWEDGVIGELYTVTSEFGFICEKTSSNPLYDLALAGGSFLDVGAYPVSMAHIVFGEPDTVIGHASFGSSEIDEQAGMLFGYRGGQMALGYSSFKVESPKEAIIVGTKGYIRIHSPFFCPSGFTLHLNDQDPQIFEVPYVGNGWNYEAVEVMNCLRDGKLESDLVPHKETLALMRTMDRYRLQIGLKFPGEM